MRKFGANLAKWNKSAPIPSLADSAASINFPPLSGPSRTFIFDGELTYPVRDFTRKSRFVLYDNGAFVLQYPSSLGDGRYRGRTRTQTASSCSCSSFRAAASATHGMMRLALSKAIR